MRQTVTVNETLTVGVVTVPDLHVVIERKDGGLVRVELVELGPLVSALSEAGGRAVAIARGETFEDVPF